jgi:hypothetical protein
MTNYLRCGTIALLLSTSFSLNGCNNGSPAKSKPTDSFSFASSVPDRAATTPSTPNSQCDALDSTAFSLQGHLSGVKMATKMGMASFLETSLESADQVIAEVKSLELSQPNVKALQAEYLRLAEAALAPVRPLTKSSEDRLKEVAADVAVKVEAASDFRKNKIFLGNCKES